MNEINYVSYGQNRNRKYYYYRNGTLRNRMIASTVGMAHGMAQIVSDDAETATTHRTTLTDIVRSYAIIMSCSIQLTKF